MPSHLETNRVRAAYYFELFDEELKSGGGCSSCEPHFGLMERTSEGAYEPKW
jgi:hypothetical protein